MNSTTEVTAHVLITGRVQAVSYRYWTRQEAERRSLKGFVRNLADGRVEAVFAGEAADVEGMIEACRNGPPAARVENIERRDWTGETPDPFEIRATARQPA